MLAFIDVASRYRHALQTSDAVGAAASQLGPDAQAAVVELNKQAGLSHGKVTQVLDKLFGIQLSRGGSAQGTGDARSAKSTRAPSTRNSPAARSRPCAGA